MSKPLNGRPAGMSNRTRRGVQEVCAKRGYDPLKELIELIPYLPKEKQASIHLEMMTYIYPKARPENEAPTPPYNPWRDKSTDEVMAALPMTNAGNKPSTH